MSRVATGLFGIGFMWLFVDILHGNSLLMKALSSIVVLVLNYVFSKLITFRKSKDEKKMEEAKKEEANK